MRGGIEGTWVRNIYMGTQWSKTRTLMGFLIRALELKLVFPICGSHTFAILHPHTLGAWPRTITLFAIGGGSST